MNQRTPPWCLHWGRDGELAQGDRLDLFRMLMSHDQQLGALMNNQVPLPADEQAATVVPTDQSMLQALTRV
jgi:hypothetical protein